MDTDKLSFWLNRWDLLPDGEKFSTHTSILLPVKTATHGIKAMLKVTDDADEQTGNSLMAWWEGHGAAQVLAYEQKAILLARATGNASLLAMSKNGQDNAACRVLCATTNTLHNNQNINPLPKLTPLHRWFAAIKPATHEHGSILGYCAEISQELLSSPQDVVVLHGDVHHDNVLDFASSGWLAIDPKGLLGERGFDFANIFTNPDLGHPELHVARAPSIFKQRLQIATEISGINRERLLKWIIAWCGLSATWSLEYNNPISVQIEIIELAIAELSI